MPSLVFYYGYSEQVLANHKKVHRIRKSAQQRTAHALLNLHPLQWIFGNIEYLPFKFV